jgi:hypothetical protein
MSEKENVIIRIIVIINYLFIYMLSSRPVANYGVRKKQTAAAVKHMDKTNEENEEMAKILMMMMMMMMMIIIIIIISKVFRVQDVEVLRVARG